MRNIVLICCLFLSLASCQDEKNNSENSTSEEIENFTEADSSDDATGTSTKNSSQTATKKDSIATAEKSSEDLLAGKYIHTDYLDDINCSCHCLEVKNSGTAELCLKENDLYINGRFQKQGEHINIYFSGKSGKTSNTDIPWDKFEKGTPIAVLTPAGNNTFNLDWKGFTIDGDIAVDYALLGKKTLEGTYKKK